MSTTRDAELAAMLEQALIDRSEERFSTIAFVNRHAIIAALARPAQTVGGERYKLTREKLDRLRDSQGIPEGERVEVDFQALMDVLGSDIPVPSPGGGERPSARELLDAETINSVHPKTLVPRFMALRAIEAALSLPAIERPTREEIAQTLFLDNPVDAILALFEGR